MDNDIQCIGNAFFEVGDMERAVRFYEQVLGLGMKFRDGDRWAAFDVGGTTLALSGAADDAPRGHGATLSLKVRDVDAWAGAARRRGLTAPEPTTGPHERTVTVTDPDGHRLVVYSSLSAGEPG